MQMVIRLVLLSVCLSLTAPAGAQVPPDLNMYIDLEKGHQFLLDLDKLHKAGFFTELWIKDSFLTLYRTGRAPGINGLSGRTTITRIGIADLLDRELVRQTESGSNRPDPAKAEIALTPEVKAALRRLVVEFRPELRALGMSDSQVEERLRHLGVGTQMVASPFKDVPSTHWAYKAVESLRLKGILRGYPDGHFDAP